MMKDCWREGPPSRSKRYAPEPDKNVVFTEEQAASVKRRKTEVRRTLEDEKIDREVEEQWQ